MPTQQHHPCQQHMNGGRRISRRSAAQDFTNGPKDEQLPSNTSQNSFSLHHTSRRPIVSPSSSRRHYLRSTPHLSFNDLNKQCQRLWFHRFKILVSFFVNGFMIFGWACRFPPCRLIHVNTIPYVGDTTLKPRPWISVTNSVFH